MAKPKKSVEELKEINKLKEEIGARLFNLRDEKISQLKLADKIDIEPGKISDYERGKSLIPIDNLRRFASYYNVTTDYLINGTKPTLNDEIALLLKSLDDTSLQQAIVYIRFLHYIQNKVTE